jgi:hypothetical protein
VAYGHGEQFALRDGRTRLEVFPESGVTRLTGANLRVELFRSSPPVVRGEEVQLALGTREDASVEATLSVAPTGGVLFTYVAEVAETPQTGERASTGGHVAASRESGGAEQPAVTASGGESGEHPPAAGRDTRERREAEERVRISGRLGRDPSFYTTARGIRVAKFPLAVEQDGGRAAWHDVLAFGDHAETLRVSIERGEDWLRKGRPVQVVGYWHENRKPNKDGTVRTVHDLYAAAVRATPPIGQRP